MEAEPASLTQWRSSSSSSSSSSAAAADAGVVTVVEGSRADADADADVDADSSTDSDADDLLNEHEQSLGKEEEDSGYDDFSSADETLGSGLLPHELDAVVLSVAHDLSSLGAGAVAAASGVAAASPAGLGAQQLAVESELGAIALDSIGDYVAAAPRLRELLAQLRECEGVFRSLGAVMDGFRADLGALSGEIAALQERSLWMSQRMRNLIAAAGPLGIFLATAAPSPRDLLAIAAGPVPFSAGGRGGGGPARADARYCTLLRRLHAMLAFVRVQPPELRACADARPALEAAARLGAEHARRTLLAHVHTLRRPHTDMQALQQRVLLREAFLYEFLQESAPAASVEVRETYAGTVATLLHASFRAYVREMVALLRPGATKDDLLGSRRIAHGSAFSLAGRDAFLAPRGTALDPAERAHLVLAPGVMGGGAAAARRGRVGYVQVFFSLYRLLAGAAAAECVFCVQFFKEDPRMLVLRIFGATLRFALAHVGAVLRGYHDAVGLLVLLAIVQECREAMEARRIRVLRDHFAILDVLIWDRFLDVLAANSRSLAPQRHEAVPTPQRLGRLDTATAPLAVTRRCAEFIASAVQIATHYRLGAAHAAELLGTHIPLLRHRLDVLLLNRLAPAGAERGVPLRCVFLVNNYDAMLAVMRERGVAADSQYHAVASFRAEAVQEYVEHQLGAYYPSLLEFVGQNCDDSADNVDAAVARQSVVVEAIAADFAHNWRPVLAEIFSDTRAFFGNFTAGAEILKTVLAQLALYYSRFGELVRTRYPDAPFRREMVSVATLTHDIQTLLAGAPEALLNAGGAREGAR